MLTNLHLITKIVMAYMFLVRGIDYEVVFSEYADEPLNSYSSTDNIGNLPWGANPETTESCE